MRCSCRRCVQPLPAEPSCVLSGTNETRSELIVATIFYFAAPVVAIFVEFFDDFSEPVVFLPLGDGLGEAFATRVFLRVGFGVGLGVAFGFGVAVGFGVDVGSGVGVGSSISLFAAVTRGVSSAASSFFNGSDSGGGIGVIAGCGDSLLSGSPAARSSAPLIQTMLCAFEELLASTLQRINPRRRATCASAIRVTFRQKRASLRHLFRLRPLSRCRPS